MKLSEYAKLMENKLMTLNQQRVQAESIGDVELVIQIDKSVIDTQLSLDTIRPLISANTEL